MIVAIPIDRLVAQAEVCVSFGRAPGFYLYDTQTETAQMLPNPAADAQGGAGIAAAQFVVDQKADVLITPRGGENAAEVLKAAHVKVFKAQGLNVADNLTALKEGKLKVLETFHAGFLHAQ